MIRHDNASPRGAYANGRARRDSIIAAASDHFAERGFGAATILDLAAACGISRAGLLHHFPDKEALLEAVLERRDAEDRRRFRPYVGIDDGLGVLVGMVDLAEHNRLVPGLIELFVRLSAEAAALDHPAHEYFLARNQRIRQGTARTLRVAKSAGYVLPEIDPDETSVRLTALMDGLQSTWLLDRDLDMAAHLRAAIFKLLSAAGEREFIARSAALAEPLALPSH